MSKYLTLIEELNSIGTGKMKVFGNSMTPILFTGSLLTFEKREEYEIGDIVFCKIRGRFIDAHLITKKSNQGYMIANNHGHENGWTKTIYGKVIQGEYKKEIIYTN